MPRHPWLARFVPDVDARVAASELNPDTPDEVEMWRVPAFTWAPGTSIQGRKGKGRLMPFRIHWNVLSDSPAPRTSTAVGPGASFDVTAEPEPVAVGQLRHEAEAARWRLFSELNSWVSKAVVAAHAVRSAEIASSRNIRDVPLLDSPALEAVADELMVGDHGFFSRMLPLIVRQTCFDKVDPERWMRTMLRRDADQAVGRAVGDVLPGPRVRRLASKLPGGSLDEIVELYNRGVSRSNRIAPARAACALLIGRTAPEHIDDERLADALPHAPSAEDVCLGVSV